MATSGWQGQLTFTQQGNGQVVVTDQAGHSNTFPTLDAAQANVGGAGAVNLPGGGTLSQYSSPWDIASAQFGADQTTQTANAGLLDQFGAGLGGLLQGPGSAEGSLVASMLADPNPLNSNVLGLLGSQQSDQINAQYNATMDRARGIAAAHGQNDYASQQAAARASGVARNAALDASQRDLGIQSAMAKQGGETAALNAAGNLQRGNLAVEDAQFKALPLQTPPNYSMFQSAINAGKGGFAVPAAGGGGGARVPNSGGTIGNGFNMDIGQTFQSDLGQAAQQGQQPVNDWSSLGSGAAPEFDPNKTAPNVAMGF